MTATSACGITIELAAGVAHARDVGDVEHRAGADEAAIAERAREQRGSTVERPRRIERHLEDAKAFAGERAGDGGDLVGRDAAQHGDQNGSGDR